MPHARSITNGTLIFYEVQLAERITSYADLATALRAPSPSPPWTAETMPRVQVLVCKPSSTFWIESGRIGETWTMAPKPSDWISAP